MRIDTRPLSPDQGSGITLDANCRDHVFGRLDNPVADRTNQSVQGDARIVKGRKYLPFVDDVDHPRGHGDGTIAAFDTHAGFRSKFQVGRRRAAPYPACRLDAAWCCALALSWFRR
jgi:hypothetical protein